MLEGGRQDQLLAEVLEVLVGREAGAERRDLEQDAARLAKVDRAEPEAVDYRRRARPGGRGLLDPARVLVERYRPCDVVDGACARDAAAVVGWIGVDVE